MYARWALGLLGAFDAGARRAHKLPSQPRFLRVFGWFFLVSGELICINSIKEV